jgi:predicted deacetylase
VTRVRAVTLHDVEPSTYDRCAWARDWLAERGVERATLLVIPAADLHAFDDRSPELARWLRGRATAGDAIAQHGFQHRRTRRPRLPRRWVASWQGGAAAEFPGLSVNATGAAVLAGRSILAGAGIEARGFVAPGFAYTGALRRALDEEFDWWASLMAVHRAGARRLLSPARVLGSSTAMKRALSPVTLGIGTPARSLLRVEIHPQDFDHPRNVRALERLLDRSAERPAVTYDELLDG